MCHIMATKMWLCDEPSAYLAPDTLPHCHPGCLSVGHGHAAPAIYTYLYLSLTTHSILHQPNSPIFPSLVLSVLIFLSLTGMIRLNCLKTSVLVCEHGFHFNSEFRKLAYSGHFSYCKMRSTSNEHYILCSAIFHSHSPFSHFPIAQWRLELFLALCRT